MPAGTVKAVFGGEWREESIDDVPDPDAQANNFWGFSTAGITRGTDKVKELFTEIEVPILTGKRFAEDMFISLSGRYTDYDSYGDDSTYRAAFNYQVTPEVLLRSTLARLSARLTCTSSSWATRPGSSVNLNDPCINYGATFQPGRPGVRQLCRTGATAGLPGNHRAFSPSPEAPRTSRLKPRTH